jgi:hypothetical protein
MWYGTTIAQSAAGWPTEESFVPPPPQMLSWHAEGQCCFKFPVQYAERNVFGKYVCLAGVDFST